MNEILINIYSITINKISESFDWFDLFTIFFMIIGLVIAYYGLLYNRPRIEIKPVFGYYDFEEDLKYIKLMFYNTGTLTAYNIKIKNNNKNKEYFYYPENHKDYEEIVKLFDKIDNIADEVIKNEHTNIREYTDEQKDKIKNLNNEIKKINPTLKDKEPNTLSEQELDIRKIIDSINRIKEQEKFIENFFDMEINMLIPNENKLLYFTNFNCQTSDGYFNLEFIDIKISYNEIKQMDTFGYYLFFLFNKILKFFNYNFDLKRKEIIIEKEENKTIYFKDKNSEEDFMKYQKIKRKDYFTYKRKEFDNFINSFYFKTWFASLSSIDKKEIYDLIIKYKYDINKYISHSEDIMQKYYKIKPNKKLKQINIKRLENILYFLNILGELEIYNESQRRDIRFLMYNVSNFKK